MNTSSQNIRFVTRQDLDLQKWDDCIRQATNSLIYAFSFYLDHMAPHWNALVLNDYEAVMPLTWNKKYGFYYLYQPFLCASLGIFGRYVPAQLVEDFLKSIPHRFRYWDIYLNHGNLFPLNQFSLYERTNHVLDLRKPAEALYADYRGSYRQLLTRFMKLGCTVQKNIPINELIGLAKDKMNPVFNIDDVNFDRFKKLYNFLKGKGEAINYGVYAATGDLLASGAFLFAGGRAYYILAGNHPNGRTLGASHQVIHSFIRDHAETAYILDFEGSDVSQIAFFFKGFGAKEEKYAGIRYNRLPPLLRWLKS